MRQGDVVRLDGVDSATGEPLALVWHSECAMSDATMLLNRVLVAWGIKRA